MPVETVHCRICGASIKGSSFAIRMKKIRHHYKHRHARTWKQSIQFGAMKRKRPHRKKAHHSRKRSRKCSFLGFVGR